MRTMEEVIQMQVGNRYDCVKQEDGTFYFYTWQPSSIVENGVVVALGKKYNKSVMHVSYDKMDILDIFDMDDDEYDEKWFVEDIRAWADAIGIKNTNGLIGMLQIEFNEEANRRYEEGE